MTTTIYVTRYASPIGQLSLATVDGKLVHLDFENNDDRLKTIQTRRFKNSTGSKIALPPQNP